MSKLRKNLEEYGKELMASNQIMSSAVKDLQAALKPMHELGMNMRRLAATPFGEDPQDFKYLYQEVVEQLTFVQRMLMSYRYVERVHDLGDDYDVAGTLGVADGFDDQQDMERYWGTDYNTSKSFRAASSKKTARQSKLRRILAQEGLIKTGSTAEIMDAISVGDIFVSSWGYNQTNIDFYEVVRKMKTMAAFRKIAKKVVGGQGQASEKVMPMPGKFTGPAIRKKVKAGWKGDAWIDLTSYSGASLWDGRPASQTGGGFGH
jgi:hypothetical protein